MEWEEEVGIHQSIGGEEVDIHQPMGWGEEVGIHRSIGGEEVDGIHQPKGWEVGGRARRGRARRGRRKVWRQEEGGFEEQSAQTEVGAFPASGRFPAGEACAHQQSELSYPLLVQPPGQPEIEVRPRQVVRPRQLMQLPVRRLVWRHLAVAVVAAVVAVDIAAFDPDDFQVLWVVGAVVVAAVVVVAGLAAHLAVAVVVVPYCERSRGGEAVGEGVLPDCCCLGWHQGKQGREQRQAQTTEQLYIN